MLLLQENKPLYNGEPEESLDIFRYKLFTEKVATSTTKCFHLLLLLQSNIVFVSISKKAGNEMQPAEWGGRKRWKTDAIAHRFTTCFR